MCCYIVFLGVSFHYLLLYVKYRSGNAFSENPGHFVFLVSVRQVIVHLINLNHLPKISHPTQVSYKNVNIKLFIA